MYPGHLEKGQIIWETKAIFSGLRIQPKIEGIYLQPYVVLDFRIIETTNDAELLEVDLGVPGNDFAIPLYVGDSAHAKFVKYQTPAGPHVWVISRKKLK